MAMPVRFRDVLTTVSAGKLVITIDAEEACLMIYPLPEWDLIQAKLEQLPSFNPAARRIQRLLIGHATDVELDSNGRILLPTVLRNHAQLDKKAILLGQGKKIELWSDALWNGWRSQLLDVEQ
jgi:MraZ protein